jgi:hypothetical protein
MIYWMNMIKLRTWWITEHRAIEGASMAMVMTMTTTRVSRTNRVVRKEPGKGTVHRMGRGHGIVMQQRKGRRREMVLGKVLLNKPQEEMISLVPLL